jgi:hypothetical protein
MPKNQYQEKSLKASRLLTDSEFVFQILAGAGGTSYRLQDRMGEPATPGGEAEDSAER